MNCQKIKLWLRYKGYKSIDQEGCVRIFFLWLKEKILAGLSFLKEKGPKSFIEEKMIDRLVAFYWQKRFSFNLRRFFIKEGDVQINKPIFFLGIQGGGLTLTSRMLRRNKEVVSISGNYKYWAGPDELMNKESLNLPKEFSLKIFPCQEHPVFGCERDNVYAANEFYSFYRKTKEDANLELKQLLEKIIKKAIIAYAPDIRKARFTDKSQVFSLKVSFINALLKEYKPKFILITRDPYIMAVRFTENPKHFRLYRKDLKREEKIKIYAEHWRNTFQTAINDSGKENIPMLILKFEDIIEFPERELKKICDFVELDFDKDMLPALSHKLPHGSTSKMKWYPIRKDANKKYIKFLSEKDTFLVEKVVGPIAKKLGYSNPFS